MTMTASARFITGPITSTWKRCHFDLREELVGGAGAGIFRVLAGHLDVAAERDRADAVFGVAAPERQQLRAEAQRKRQDADADPPRHHEMAELVDENQDAEDKNESQNAGHRRSYLTGHPVVIFTRSAGPASSTGELPRPPIDGPHIVQPGNRGRAVPLVGLHRLRG